MNIIGNKWIFLGISSALVLASIGSIMLYGFKPGIDFSGGTLWQIKFETEPTVGDLVTFFTEKTDVENPIITTEKETESYLIRIKEIDETDHSSILSGLKESFGNLEELRFDSIGASIGNELKNKAITAFIAVLVGISLYIAFAFRKVSRPVSSWKYGTITLITLFHDALIPAGIMALLGHFKGIEVDTNFIVALLVVMGFSVHDTIVVFDRIREHLRGDSGRTNFDTLVNESVNETIARSINTSFTLILVLIALYFFGAPTLKYFILTMLVGTAVGTYSSIFVASPILTLWRKKA